MGSSWADRNLRVTLEQMAKDRKQKITEKAKVRVRESRAPVRGREISCRSRFLCKLLEVLTPPEDTACGGLGLRSARLDRCAPGVQARRGAGWGTAQGLCVLLGPWSFWEHEDDG